MNAWTKLNIKKKVNITSKDVVRFYKYSLTNLDKAICLK